jgi:hypothetical protein
MQVQPRESELSFRLLKQVSAATYREMTKGLSKQPINVFAIATNNCSSEVSIPQSNFAIDGP